MIPPVTRCRKLTTATRRRWPTARTWDLGDKLEVINLHALAGMETAKCGLLKRLIFMHSENRREAFQQWARKAVIQFTDDIRPLFMRGLCGILNPHSAKCDKETVEWITDFSKPHKPVCIRYFPLEFPKILYEFSKYQESVDIQTDSNQCNCFYLILSSLWFYVCTAWGPAFSILLSYGYFHKSKFLLLLLEKIPAIILQQTLG